MTTELVIGTEPEKPKRMLISNQDPDKKTFWGDAVRVIIENNANTVLKLEGTDRLLLNQELLFKDTNYARDKSKGSYATAGLWFYLAELGVALIRKGTKPATTTKPEEINKTFMIQYLNATKNLSREYKDKMYAGSQPDIGYLINTPWFNNQVSWNVALNDTLPMNFIAAFAYFNVVYAEVFRIVNGFRIFNAGFGSFYERSIGRNMYSYLHTQLEQRIGPDGKKNLTNWKYAEYRASGTSDDVGHGGIVARSICYGAERNYIWIWWASSIARIMRPRILDEQPERVDFTGHKSLKPSPKEYWKFRYSQDTFIYTADGIIDI